MPAAIVTGSDSGIGKAAAVHLARAGYDIGVTWHEDEEGARETAQEVEAQGRRAEVRRLDLSVLPGAADVVDELAGALGGVDVFVNNSGLEGRRRSSTCRGRTGRRRSTSISTVRSCAPSVPRG